MNDQLDDSDAQPLFWRRSMDSAPKDGRALLVYLPGGPKGYVARQDIITAYWSGISWRAVTGFGQEIYPPPSHWMPLPDSPRST